MQLGLTITDRIPSRSYAAVALGIWAASTLVSIAVSQIFLLVSGTLFILGRLRKLHPIYLPPILLPVSAFVIATFMSLALSPDPAEGAASIRKLVLFCSILLVASVFRTSKEIMRVLTGIVAISALAALLSFYQLAENLRTVSTMKKTYGMNAPEAYSYFIYGRRMTGFMSHWMTFSGEQMLVFSMMTSLLLFSPFAKKKWWWVSYVLIGFSLILGCVRGAWIGTLVAFGFLLYLKSKTWLICLPLLILFLSFVLPWEVVYRGRTAFDLSRESRFFQWRTGWNMIKTHPWKGVGPNRISTTFDRYKPQGEPTPPGWHGHLHNNFIQFAAERGIPCMIVWCWLMWTWGYRLLSLGRIQQDSFAQALCWGGCACVLALVTAGLFEFNFGDSEVLMLFLFLGTAPFVSTRAHWR
jgi:putative inorganic carbon (hco3(-)) transporter